MVSPQAKREAVSTLINERGFGVTRACGLVRMSRSSLADRIQHGADAQRARQPDAGGIRSGAVEGSNRSGIFNRGL